MRKEKYAALLVLMAFCMSACTANTDETEVITSSTISEETTIVETEETTQVETSETSATEETDSVNETESATVVSPIPQQYQDLIDSYCLAIQNGEDRDEYAMCMNADIYALSDTECTDIYICDIYDDADPLADYGYIVKDIDNNGTPELLITNADEDCVYAMYTINDDGQVVRYFYSWSRNRYNVFADGYVSSFGSNGASWQSSERDRIDGSDFIFVSRIDYITTIAGERLIGFYEDETLYPSSIDGDYYIAPENLVDEEFLEQYYSELQRIEDVDYVSFSEHIMRY